MQTIREQAEKICREIFTQVRTTIVLNMRFLDMAVFRLRPVPENVTLATDGELLYYRPSWLLRRFRDESDAVTRDYLHVLLHCIFRHPFVHSLVDQRLWDLACDISVEGLICEWRQPRFSVKAEVHRQVVADSLRAKVKPLTAEKLYRYFRDHPPEPDWPRLFRADDHSLWHDPGRRQRMAQDHSSPDTRSGDGDPSGDPAGSSGPQDSAPSNGPDSGNRPDGGNRSDTGSPRAGDLPQSEWSGGPGRSVEDEWRDISEHVQMDLESFGKQQGLAAGDMQQMLAELNRERYDYEAFLKKFAVMGEVMKINDDEFDTIFYTYGLKLYKNMPLIEPLEYKEVKRIREFVIAIDTSGSTGGELVQMFLTKTYNILMSTESFFSRVNLHIVQCDTEIQEAVKITKREELDEYLKHLTVRGLGGTDFRPVFSYVDRLIRQHEFRHLKGLIYFTDGFGTFPERKPDYTTAFVFIRDDWFNPDVPPWAIRLILEKDELRHPERQAQSRPDGT